MELQKSKYRWVVFISVTFTYLLMSSQRTAPGLITDQIMLEFAVPLSTIGLLTSIQYFVYTGLQIPMGILSDRFGPNFFIIIGALLTGIGTIVYSVSTNESLLFVGRILTGLGDATIWVNMVIILGKWFPVHEFVKLIGVAGMTGSLGFLLATIPFSTFIALLGWRLSFLSFGILLCISSFLLYIVLVKKPKDLFGIRENKDDMNGKKEKTTILLRRVFSNRQAWALFCCHFGLVGSYVGFISSWAVPYGMNIFHFNRTEASILVLMGVLGAIVGAPLSSWVCSRLNTIKKPYTVIHFISLCGWLTFFIFRGKPPLFIVIFLFFIIGFSYGASALTFAIVRNQFPIHESGFVSGIANTGGFLSAVLLPSIFGFILNYFHQTSEIVSGFQYGFMTPIIFSLIGVIGIFSIKERKQERGHEMNP